MSDSIENLLVRNLYEVFGNATRHGARPRSRRYSIAIASSSIHAASMSDIEPWTMRLSPSRHSSPDHVFSQIGVTPCRIVGGSTGHSARRTNRARSPDWTLPS
jgi:hypothetical protein